ncbi:MAG: hypothetical protein J1F16_04825 [Muribaculaceae bacterium]|nr:hypothetical protein [Muribaculaceae bacterium]
MAEIKIAGIMRAGAYSPNHIGNDAAIFNAVADQLRRRGCEVELMSEEQFLTHTPSQNFIMDMCREKESVLKLQQLEEEGRLVINSGFGIENCTRERMTRILIGNNIPTADSLIVNTNEKVIDDLKNQGITSCWIKRGEYHSMHKEDVSYCRHPEEAQEVLHEFFYRGIKRAVINRHLQGDLVKFYGVVGQPFFFWFYPFDEHHSKYGYEEINGESQHLPFDEKALMDMCNRTAEIFDIKIYGGDCIVDKDGTVRIIDFNDWPSFAPCRKEAAPYIAKCIFSAIKDWKKKN